MENLVVSTADIEGTISRIRAEVNKGRAAHKEYEELQGKDPAKVLAEYDSILVTLDKFDNEVKLGRYWSIRDTDLLDLKFKLKALTTLVDPTEDIDAVEFYKLDQKLKEAYWDYRDLCDDEFDDIETLSEYTKILTIIRDTMHVYRKYKGRLTKGTYDALVKLATPLLPKVVKDEE